MDLFTTDDGAAQLIARLTVGIVMFMHGAQKLLGWFGGYGFSGTMGLFTQQMHIPAPLAFLVIFTEFFGALALIAGLLTRIAAFAVAFEMVVAIAMVHWPNGFFMNWFGKQAGEGFEYHLLVIGVCIALIVAGAGRWSIDRLISETYRPRVDAVSRMHAA